MKSLLLAATILGISAGTVSAQDTDFNWSGLYVGAQAGYAWGDAEHFTHAGTSFPFTHNDINGYLFGAYVGFNHQLPSKIVVGVEGDVAFTKLQGGPDSSVNKDGAPERVATAETKAEWTGSVRARLGYSMGRFMPYIGGGLAIAKAETINNRGVFYGQVRDVMTGWTLGGGAEYAATDNIIMRLEYRYSDFGRASAVTYQSINALQSVDIRTHDIRLGIAYKF